MARAFKCDLCGAYGEEISLTNLEIKNKIDCGLVTMPREESYEICKNCLVEIYRTFKVLKKPSKKG